MSTALRHNHQLCKRLEAFPKEENLLRRWDSLSLTVQNRVLDQEDKAEEIHQYRHKIHLISIRAQIKSLDRIRTFRDWQ